MKSQDTRSLKSRKSLLSFGVSALLAVGAFSAQIATATGAPGATGIDATGSFQSEMAACAAGATQQDRETCMKEARNAQADKRRGVLDTQGPTADNALSRCEVHAGAEDRAACKARILGMGSTDGSVAGGGLIREVETVVLPAGQNSVTIQPRTSDPVVLVPSK